jgi:predicted MPP superfamily phosphohydrolase
LWKALALVTGVDIRKIVLQLTGHSHGGQVRLPFVGAPLLPYLGRKYSSLQRTGQTFVSREVMALALRWLQASRSAG